MFLLSGVLMSASSGCYYGQLALGQCQLMWHREPINSLLQNPATPAPLRARLALVEQVRSYGSELGLDVGRQYTSYVAWPGDRVLTTLVATRPGEVEAAAFDFPVVGRLPYKGFFDRSAAEHEAADLRARGLDVCVTPVRAYSTLGWFADPLTGPMLLGGDLQLIETVLHELVHATVYVPGDADFNEGVATFVGREAAAQFLAAHGLPGDSRSPAQLAAAQRARSDRRLALSERLQRLRADVAGLYAAGPASPQRARMRERLSAGAREDLAAFAPEGMDAEQFAGRIELGDACLALRGTYGDDLERHRELLAALGGNLNGFMARLARSANSATPRESFFERVGPAHRARDLSRARHPFLVFPAIDA